ncbi:MAG: rhodanese-related sulfurtransferase [Rhodothermales bacterium]
MNLPEITVTELAEMRNSQAEHVLLDVREMGEFSHCRIEGAIAAPLSHIAQKGLAALPKGVTHDQRIVVQCHHGSRSAQITAWLMQEGYEQVSNLAGGIDAWSREIDPDVARY